MALTQGMKEQIAKDAGVKDAFAKGDKAAAKIIATMAELGLTGGVIGAGGKLVYKGIKGVRAMAEARKAIAAAKKAQQAKKTKPATSAKPKTETGRTTVMPKKSRSVTTTTRTAPKTTRQTKPMKRAQATDKPSAKRAVKSPPKAPAKKGLTKAQKAAIAGGVVLGGLTGVGIVDRVTRKKNEAKADRKPVVGVGQTGPDKSKSKPKVKPSVSYQPGNAGSKNRKSGAGTSPDKAKEGTKQKRTNISASKNTGFGPGGNLFPSSDADRKRLMKIWGGTGSRAAAAAKDGSQGTWLADSKKRKKK
tara:strand:+ start:158 stop:1069 length:912 start_codon:yes stop_codon:yes gene_type:complete